MNFRQKLFVGFLVIASLVGVVGYYGIRTLGIIQQNSQLADQLDQFLVKSRARDSVLSKITNSADVAIFMELKQELRQLHADADALSAQMLKLPRFKTIADMTKVVQIENEYDKTEKTILQRHHELLTQKKVFTEAYPKEKALRYALRKPIFRTKDPKLIRDFGSLQYFGKEALYQYEDKKHVHEWLQSINNVANGIKTWQIGLSAKEKEDLLLY